MRDYDFYYTQDGSVGLYSYADDDVYHSKYGALTEAWQKFVIPSGITSLLNTKENIRVLDVCYGVGYNTKALMSYVISANENLLKIKNKKKFINNFKKSLKNFGEELKEEISIDTIDNNKFKYWLSKLLLSIETEEEETVSKVHIDCLDINEELVKISPYLKTLITPQEIYTLIVPKIFDCFDLYWKIKNLISIIGLFFMPHNKAKITEKLNLKFNNDYDKSDREYRIHKFVNVIIIDQLLKLYKDNYITKDILKVLKNHENRRYLNVPLAKYAILKQKIKYDFISRFNLIVNLHNIYYDYLSKRYKNAKFKQVSRLFDVNFYVNDARKTILQLEGEYDFMFLDAFTYSKAPELWTVEFIAELYNKLSRNGVIMTYSTSALVRNTFIENKFYVGKILDEKTGKFIGTIAAKEKSMIEHPLSNYELGLCSTRAGIPYHDTGLGLPRDVILDKREFVFKNSDLLTSTQYIKRRLRKNNEDDDDGEE